MGALAAAKYRFRPDLVIVLRKVAARRSARCLNVLNPSAVGRNEFARLVPREVRQRPPENLETHVRDTSGDQAHP